MSVREIPGPRGEVGAAGRLRPRPDRPQRAAVARAAAGVVGVVALLAGGVAPAARADVVERVIATVNDEPIFLSELRRRAVPFLPQVARVPELQREAAVRQLYAELLDHLIDEQLILQAARRDSVRVTADDVDRAIRNVQRQSQLGEAEFWRAVRGQGFTEAQYRDDVRRQLIRLKLLNNRARGRVNITEADVRAKYDELVRRANAQHAFVAADILVPVPQGASATEVAAARARAQAIRDRITDDNFDAMLEEHGGVELGTLQSGQLDPVLERELLRLPTGGVSQPVQNAAGFHILKLRAREEGAGQIPPYAQVREQVYRQMLEEAMGRQEQLYLRELRRAGVVVRRI